MVVAAVEHRDASAAATFVMEEGKKKWTPFRRILDTEKEYTVRNEQLHQTLSSSLEKGNRLKTFFLTPISSTSAC